MSTATKLLVAAACAGLVACQTGPAAPPGRMNLVAKPSQKPAKIKNCMTGNEDKCDVVVTVKFDPNGSPYLVVDDDDLFRLVKKNKKPRITWTLNVFPANSNRVDDFAFDTSATSPGIDFGTEGGAQIPCSRPGAKTATCEASQLRNDGLTAYKYTINVVDVTKANTVYPLDPWVVAE